MLKVGVDCWALRINGAGARYVFESIFSVIEKNEKYKFILFLHPEAEVCIRELQNHVGVLKNTIKIKIKSPGEILKYEKFVDVFYSPFNNISFRYFGKPVVSVLHDVQERHLPEMFSPEELEGRHEDYDDIVRSSTRTITISNFCKQSIIEHCGADRNKIDVIYNAPQRSLQKYVNSEEIKQQRVWSDIHAGQFIFCPANFYPHKNHIRLLEAYARCLKVNHDMPLLVLMGMLSEGSDIERKINALSLQDKVKVVSRVPGEALAWLYRHCRYVVIPTLFEGFCLPAAEALMFNKPLLCSDLDILREVTIGNASFFRPDDIQEMSEKMLLGLKAEQAQPVSIEDHYNWEKAGHNTLKAIDRAFSEYYREPVTLKKLSESSFCIYLDGDLASLSDIENTISSIETAARNSAAVDVWLSIKESSKQEIFDQILSGRRFSQAVTLNLVKEDTAFHRLKNDYFSYVVAGNKVSTNYFLDIVKSSGDDSSDLIVGELHQIHEDVAGTFETSVYFRLNRGNLILNGSFYPEMFVSRSPSYIQSLRKDKSSLATYVKPIIASGKSKVARINLGAVLFKNSTSFERIVKRHSRLGFTPVDFLANPESVNVNKLLQDQEFIDFVHHDVAKKLGKELPPVVEEAKRQIKLAENSEELV